MIRTRWLRWGIGPLAVLAFVAAACPPTPAAEICLPEVSVARTWNDALLDAIRRDFPAPTVHARNLYHLSVVAWDGWAMYQPEATGVFWTDKIDVDDSALKDHQSITISYAAHRLLVHRYRNAVGGEDSLAQFDRTMTDLCLDPEAEPAEGSPGAIGVEMATAVIELNRNDGSLEPANYVSLDYAPVNPAMDVRGVGTELPEPNHWQPLSFDVQITQNGLELPAGAQEFIGPNWGRVVSFALEPDPTDGLPIDPGPPPLLGVDDAGYVAGAVEVIELSSLLDPAQSEVVDTGPARFGGSRLGTNDGSGHPTNPATGAPYEPNPTVLADYARVVAEYWADGPDSETPPGHWNTLTNEVSDQLGASDRLVVTGVVEHDLGDGGGQDRIAVGHRTDCGHQVVGRCVLE